MIPEARQALEASSLIVGYSTYISLLKPLYPDKAFLAKGMRQEIQRAMSAIEEAKKGKTVSLISGGDVGIYGMAGLVFDICKKENIAVAPPEGADLDLVPQDWELRIKIIPGVSALNAAAALLGAPLMHDFAAISLSDHLTPWALIEKRIRAAASADFVIVFYNPRSRTRPDLLDKALSILLEYRSPETPVGIVKKAMREGQEKIITKAGSISTKDVDMQTVIIVGNTRTYIWRGWMVTPRGYDEKYFGP